MQPFDGDRQTLDEVEPLREASREVVRELGMLEATYEGSVTHPQCHALLELERSGVLTISELAERLRVDKSAMSRTVRVLQQRRLVTDRVATGDRRRKPITLTAMGRKAVHKINVAASRRVDEALRVLNDSERKAVVDGMALYARALRRARVAARVRIRPITTADDPTVARIIQTVMTEHGAVGPGFAIVDPEVVEMSAAYTPDADPAAGYFVLDDGGEVVGGAGFAPLRGGSPGVCELRKMYLLPHTRGCGLGRRLLEHVLAAAREAGYRRCYLETMATMQRARALYASAGFEPLARPEGATGHFGCDAWYARPL